MAEPLRRPAGWQEILDAPEGVKAEVIGGELILSPRPRPAHGRGQAALAVNVSGPFDLGRGGPGGWWILIEPDVLFGDHDIVSPDFVGWRRYRLPVLPDEAPVAVVPNWVCEILSPSTACRDRTIKSDLYLEAGVPYYWLLDMDQRTLEAYEAQAGRWVRLGAWTDGDIVRIAPFDAIELEVGTLFPPAPEASLSEQGR